MSDNKKKNGRDSYNYSQDKRMWLYFKNEGSGHTKIKLRKFLSDVVKDVTLVNGKTYNENREEAIKNYNINGLDTLKSWVDSEIKNED